MSAAFWNSFAWNADAVSPTPRSPIAGFSELEDRVVLAIQPEGQSELARLDGLDRAGGWSADPCVDHSVRGRMSLICCTTQVPLTWLPSCGVGRAAPNVHLRTPKALLTVMLLLLFLLFKLGVAGGRLGIFRRMGMLCGLLLVFCGVANAATTRQKSLRSCWRFVSQTGAHKTSDGFSKVGTPTRTGLLGGLCWFPSVRGFLATVQARRRVYKSLAAAFLLRRHRLAPSG